MKEQEAMVINYRQDGQILEEVPRKGVISIFGDILTLTRQALGLSGPALKLDLLSSSLDQMDFRGPFQIKPFHDSVIYE